MASPYLDMSSNRTFKRLEADPRDSQGFFWNVSETARQWNFAFALFVERHLLSQYLVPNNMDDDEGYYLVGSLVGAIDDTLQGKHPARLTSLGKLLKCELLLTLRRRRRNASEQVPLLILIGPCDTIQAVHVLEAGGERHSGP